MNPLPLLASLAVPEQWSLAAPLLLIACWVSHRLGRLLRLLLRRARNRHRVAVMRAEVGVLPPVNATVTSSDLSGRADPLAGIKAVSRVGLVPTAAHPGPGYRRGVAQDAGGRR